MSNQAKNDPAACTERTLMSAGSKEVAALPGCVLADIAQYHDVECQCVYCAELRRREQAQIKVGQGG